MKKRIMIVGGGGRESAFAQNLAGDSKVYAVISHKNPTIVRCVAASGGAYVVGNVSDAALAVEFARRHHIDYAFISADEPLACGVVDALLAEGIRAIGGSRAATRIEWDKVYSIDVMHKLCPQFTPFYLTAATVEELETAIAEFRTRGLEVVVKPQGLTGGKGVKVMPLHLPTYEEAAEYGRQLLAARSGEAVLLVEKLQGLEFTIMGITDGEHLVMAPATYDYPYRLEGDLGAGTGGMGCFTAAKAMLPFMRHEDWENCREIMQSVIDYLRKEGLSFCGVLNGGFFLTKDGIRFMEFNGRFGDPEALNVIPLLATPLSEVLASIWEKTLSPAQTPFRPLASVVKYLVAKEYPDASPTALDFSVDEAAITAQGAIVSYASCIAAGGVYQTLKKSRVVAITALADDIAAASEKINICIERYVSGALEYRRDIGAAAEVDRLTQALAARD